MRSSKSRSRGKNRSSNRSPANNINRVFDSSGPEGKVRGTPQQIIDKYTQLARDAFLGNDRVAAENFQQHAEHYTRLLAEAQRDADEKRIQSDQQNRDRQQQGQQGRGRDRDDRDRGPEAAAVIDPAEAEQPDIFDIDEADSGLVETPEARHAAPAEPEEAKAAKPKRPSRPRKPKAPKDESGAGATAETPDAAAE